MGMVPYPSLTPFTSRLVAFPSTRGPMSTAGVGFVLAQQRLANDSIGTTTLTLTNVPVGATCELETQSAGTQVAVQVAATSSPTFAGLSLYPAGNANNSLRIKVRKSDTAPYYKPQEALLTLTASAASVYIPQVLDQ